MTPARLAVAVTAVLVAALAGCGQGPSPQDWAGTVCHALGPWRAQIDALNVKAAAEMAQATTAAETRDNLVELVTGAETASEAARVAVAAAGVPDVDGGQAVATSFVSALRGTRDAYAKARTDLLALDPSDEARFYDGVQAVLARLNADYQASAVDTGALSSPELREAFDGLESCR
jgi:hypothetical protein